jgi:hypothetical protein
MNYVRKTVTIPQETARAVEELADGNVSAFVTMALEHQVRVERLRLAVTDFEAEHGEIPPEALARVDEAWRV